MAEEGEPAAFQGQPSRPGGQADRRRRGEGTETSDDADQKRVRVHVRRISRNVRRPRTVRKLSKGLKRIASVPSQTDTNCSPKASRTLDLLGLYGLDYRLWRALGAPMSDYTEKNHIQPKG